MAKYWNTTKHEDTVEKRPLNTDDIKFLKMMQTEMNTQDHLGQASPRYWTIRDYRKIYGDDMNNPDGICIYDPNACETLYEGEFDKDEIKLCLESYVDHKEDMMTAINDCDILSELSSYLNDIDLQLSEYEEYPYDSGMFLTHEAAIQHLKSNNYHYSSKAHTYAQTAWRSREERLWTILEQIDWSTYETKGDR